MMKCRQCHFWNNFDGIYKCNCIYGNENATSLSNACEHFDYWRNYEKYISQEEISRWLELSGESEENGQIKLFQ